MAFFGATPVSIPHHTASLEVETVFGPGTSEFESKHYAFLSHCGTKSTDLVTTMVVVSMLFHLR